MRHHGRTATPPNRTPVHKGTTCTSNASGSLGDGRTAIVVRPRTIGTGKRENSSEQPCSYSRWRASPPELFGKDRTAYPRVAVAVAGNQRGLIERALVVSDEGVLGAGPRRHAFAYLTCGDTGMRGAAAYVPHGLGLPAAVERCQQDGAARDQQQALGAASEKGKPTH